MENRHSLSSPQISSIPVFISTIIKMKLSFTLLMMANSGYQHT